VVDDLDDGVAAVEDEVCEADDLLDTVGLPSQWQLHAEDRFDPKRVRREGANDKPLGATARGAVVELEIAAADCDGIVAASG
jgi:hypothetical protein